MDVVLIVCAIVLVVMAVSAGTALGLHLVAPRWSVAKRSVSASCFATLLPMAIAFGGFFFDTQVGMTEDFLLGLLALVLATVVLACAFCLPPAWFVSSSLARTGERGAVPMLENVENDANRELLPAE